jgi:hypothetical protein
MLTQAEPRPAIPIPSDAMAWPPFCSGDREDLMAKLLTIFLRMAFFLLGTSFLLALVVSYLHGSRSISLPLGATSWDAISSPSGPDHPGDLSCCYLIDRETNHCDVVPLPSGNRWGQLSVSPWRDAEGNAEAVCQSFGLPASSAEQSFWGLARLRLPEGKVIDEVNLNLLPTGRACWVPAHPGRILFAAGDGQLYLHDFPGWSSDPNETVTDAAARSDESTLCQVRWKGSPPLGASVFITDPVWPGHARLRHLVFATVIPMLRNSERMVSEPTKLLWLQMRDDGAVIEAAGLLDVPTKKASGDLTVLNRFPNVELGRDGTIRLVYLSRIQGDCNFRLEVVPIEIDSETGHPRVPAPCLPCVLDEDCAPVPPLFSADGMTVYMVSRNSGLIVKRKIDSDSPGKIHVASRR